MVAGVRLFWQIKEGRKKWSGSLGGAYLLAADLKAATAED